MSAIAELTHITDEQRDVITTSDRITICKAAPGSGKTLVVAARVAHLIEIGIAPESIRCFVFTRAAAAEVRNRIDRFLGRAVGGRVDVCTFHEFAVRHVLAKPELSDFSVATERDCQAAIDSLYESGTRLPTRHQVKRRTLDKAITHFAATADIDTAAEKAVEHLIDRHRRAGNVPLWSILPMATAIEVPRVDHVIVDECQDLTPVEGEFARHSWTGDGSFLAVGDPAQAIFGWLGADLELALGWCRGDAIHRPLTRSFRFGFQIAAHANGIIESGIVGAGPDGEVRHAETLEQAIEGLEPREAAILCRTNRECDLVERRLQGWAVATKRNADDALESTADRFEECWRAGTAVISTAHAFKGREAKNVIVAMYLSTHGEERNLSYVAVTRPERTLILTEPVR